MGGGEGGAYSRRGAYFKFRPIGGGAYSRGALIRGFTEFNEFLRLRSVYRMVLKGAVSRI